MQHHRAPWWLPGGHLQTIWPALCSRPRLQPAPAYRRERWLAPDGDFIDVDHLDAAPGAPALVLFHGLESSSSSRYALAFAQVAQAMGWHFSVPHFRGCSGELNHAPRAYHSGDFEEIGWMLQRLRAQHGAPLLAAGVSLGGNALLRWAEEAGDSAAATVRAAAAVSSPLDLAAAGHAIDHGFNRLVYARNFLKTMKPRALAKWAQHPGLFDRERLLRARTLYEFDDVFTAPLHGFRDTPDYWARASAKPHLHRVRVPALVLNAHNDPFVPGASLPVQRDVGPCVTLWQPRHGGHVGFAGGAFPGTVVGLPQAVLGWLAQAL
ncbi:YheT family hydrolase [Rubrivivax sp. RP6-9]|uniref:YheT family hydrolase n=1 Tax=Rubrivivax sp. RP6-9 TaxID=3415750 RepID=UPI003CC52A34